MDWGNERYARVYVAESHDELRMGWEGWALFVQLLRRTDRAGVIECGDTIDIPILAARVRIPEDVVERALPRVLATGAVQHRGKFLVIPNKQEAEEAKQSDAQRSRESRARRRELAMAGDLGVFDNNVTNRDGAVTNRDASVTLGHTLSHAVTRCHSDADADADADAKSWREQARTFRLRRTRLKKTQVDLSKALIPGGVERKQLRAWEAGKEQPAPHVVERWAHVLTTWEARAAEVKAQEPPSEHRDFVAWFEGRFALMHNGAKPTWDGRTGKAVQALLSQHGLAEVQRRAGHMFDSVGQWPVSGPGDANIATLRSHFDRFVTPRTPTSQDSRKNTATTYRYRDARDIDPSTY